MEMFIELNDETFRYQYPDKANTEADRDIENIPENMTSNTVYGDNDDENSESRDEEFNGPVVEIDNHWESVLENYADMEEYLNETPEHVPEEESAFETENQVQSSETEEDRPRDTGLTGGTENDNSQPDDIHGIANDETQHEDSNNNGFVGHTDTPVTYITNANGIEGDEMKMDHESQEHNNAIGSNVMEMDKVKAMEVNETEQGSYIDNVKVITSDTQENGKDMTEVMANKDIETKKTDAPLEPSLKWKVIKTIFLVFVWICLGLMGEITGPTLLDLKLRTHSNYESVSSGVSGRSAGFFIGSAVGGLLVDRFGLFCDIMIALSLVGEAAATSAIPWMPDTNLIFVMTLGQGTMEGVINIAGQKLMLNMWKERAAGPLHLLHGGFGIGSFIIPLIANPFLAVTEKLSENTSATENVTHMPGVTVATVATTTTEIVIEESKMEFAYFVAAGIAVCVSLVFYGYHFAGSKDRELQRQYVGNDKSDTRKISFKEMFNPATCADGNFIHGVLIFILTFLYFVQCVGGERVGGKFIRTYSIKYLDFSDDDGSYINTVFWIAFAIGRVLGLLTARFIPIRLLIMLETGGCLITSILLVIFADDSSKALWVLMPIIGFFIAPLFPSGVGWANYHIEMTGVAITFFMLGGSVGGIIYMRLTGYLFDNYGYKSFLYMLLGFSVGAVGIASLMNIVGIRHGSRFDKEKKEKDIDMNNKEEAYAVKFENKGYNPE